jgi:hypothetical protein
MFLDCSYLHTPIAPDWAVHDRDNTGCNPREKRCIDPTTLLFHHKAIPVGRGGQLSKYWRGDAYMEEDREMDTDISEERVAHTHTHTYTLREKERE